LFFPDYMYATVASLIKETTLYNTEIIWKHRS